MSSYSRGKDSVDVSKRIDYRFASKRYKNFRNLTESQWREEPHGGENRPCTTKNSRILGVFVKFGQGWIRTTVVSRRQIYSLFPLATRAPTLIKFSINLPLMGFEPMASPLPRECATPAPQRLISFFGVLAKSAQTFQALYSVVIPPAKQTSQQFRGIN